MQVNEEAEGIKISEFPNASEISSSDIVTGLHSGENANFTFSRIMAWFREAVTAFFVPTSREINGYPLEGDINLTASDVDGVEERILATVETNSEKLSQHNYSVGQCLMMGHNFYKVISPISINDTLTEGTNIEKTTVSARIVEVEGEIPTTPGDIGATAESVVAQVEAGPTSGHSYAQGNYLIYGGALCKAIVPISTGDTIEEGTNVETVTIGGELEEIRGDIPTQPSDIGAQGEILVSGILKGNGVGGISAAQPGTDYGTYSKPSGGIPAADMTSAVQTSLGKADTAYQKPSGGIPASDLANGVIPTVPSASVANPQMDGTASPGSTGEWADGGHVHPTDTTRAAAALEINGHALTGDFDLTAADVGAMPTGATPSVAGRLANIHQITTAAAGWYKFLTVSMDAYTRQTMIIAVESRYGQNAGLLRIHTRRNTGGTNLQSVSWIASGLTHPDIRWDYADGTWTFYILKALDPDGYFFQVVSKTDGSYGAWISEAVAEPVSAAEASDSVGLNANANGLLFSSVAVSAGTAQQILSVLDAKITADYALAQITFADPAYITGGGSWASTAGSFTLTGTATAATTADVLLVRKGN